MHPCSSNTPNPAWNPVQKLFTPVIIVKQKRKAVHYFLYYVYQKVIPYNQAAQSARK